MTRPLGSASSQLEVLVEAGVARLAGITEQVLRDLCPTAVPDGAVLAVHPMLVPASGLTPLLSRDGKPGFVVVDMTDLDEFTPAEEVAVPDRPLYWIRDVRRGDELANWSPNEALPQLRADGRSPLTVTEGISWLLQQPEALQQGRGFMCIGSRKARPDGRLDARTPALWVSNGTSRDGRARAGAPKTGWCWAGNRHTWLGFASTAERG